MKEPTRKQRIVKYRATIRKLREIQAMGEAGSSEWLYDDPSNIGGCMGCMALDAKNAADRIQVRLDDLLILTPADDVYIASLPHVSTADPYVATESR